MSFDDLGLGPETLRAVADAGYLEPTPIQSKAIPYVLMGRDIVGVAQTGTGKTAGFTLPLIDILAGGQAKARMPRALILEPTRELADQVKDSFVKYGKYHRLTTALLIGGMSFGDQEKLLDRGVDVLIATPGRLLDHFERGKVMLTGVKILVIDEADRMMDMGFMPDVERIVKLTPPLRQSLFFSATMPPEMRRLANAFLSNPKEISVAPPASPAERVQQSRIAVGKRDKRSALFRLLQSEDVKNAIIFCNRKRDVDLLYKALKKEGFNAAAIHGDLAQSVRMETLEGFKSGRISLLVASDVAARGLDVQGLSHVFNYDVPMSAEDYVHRIGRTGRAGQAGRAYMLVTPDDDRYLAAIHTLIRKEIPAETLSGIAVESAVGPALEAPGDDAPAAAEAKPAKRPARSRRRSQAAADSVQPSEQIASTDPATQDAETEETTLPEEALADRPAAKPRRRRGSSASARKKAEAVVPPADASPSEPVAEQGQPDDLQDSAPATTAGMREKAGHDSDQTGSRQSSAKDGQTGAAAMADRPRADSSREATGTSGSPQPRKNEPPARGRRTEGRRRNGRGTGGEGRQAEAGKPVLGMGDHVPAFMMRPVRRQQG